MLYDPASNSHHTKRSLIDHQSRHPLWNFNGLNYDVMVLRLQTPISDDDPDLKPIVMNTDPARPVSNETLKVFGFGRTEHAVVPRSLREADVRYISNAECRQMVAQSGLSSNVPPIPDNVICTTVNPNFGSTATSTCFGDSGGPLTTSDGTSLVGIISFAAQCTADRVPNGYTRVSLVADWIKQQICLLSQSPPADCPPQPPPNPSHVELELVFIHDFFPEETVYYVRNKADSSVVYSGPQYVPVRNGQWRVSIFLPPGEYSFDIYDKRNNGLRSNGQGFGDGRWRISALYDGNTETELASGGPDFLKSQSTAFVVKDRSTTSAPEIAKNSLGKSTVKIGANTMGRYAENRWRPDGGRVRGLQKTQPSPKPRIVDGTRADPSLAQFFAKAAGDELYWTPDRLCGAALIHSDILVSAAHCQGAFNYGVLLYDPGTNDYTRRMTIEKQSRHPLWDYNPTAWNYDVLVMRLNLPISSNDAELVPIALNQDDNFPSGDDKLLALGFGVTEQGGSSEYLRTAEMNYLNNTDCVDKLNTFGNLNSSNLPDEFLCTSSDSQVSVCDGDSGGPITSMDSTSLAGIASFGSGCSAHQFPNVHVRVSKVSEWIKEQVCNLSNNPPEDCMKKEFDRDESKVELSLIFAYDFFAEDITYAIRATDGRSIVYSGPSDVAQRNGRQKTAMFLPPGDYTFEVFDRRGNGLDGMGTGDGNGWWRISALYDGDTPAEIASGNHVFERQQITAFTVQSLPTVIVDKDESPSRPVVANKDSDRLGHNQNGSIGRLRRHFQGYN
jgi:secreted trypsin-like serine protease